MVSEEIRVRLDPGAGMARRIACGRWSLVGIAPLKEEAVPVVFEVEQWWGRTTADAAMGESARPWMSGCG